MPWQVYGPMMRRQEQVARERREDRERRVDNVRERRERGDDEADAAPVTCPRCGLERPAHQMRLTGDGEVCAVCLDGADLQAGAARTLRVLAVSAPVAGMLALGAAFIANVLLAAELNMTLTAFALGLIAVGTGWSAHRRATSLLQTADVLAVPEPLARTTRTAGWAGMLLGGLAMLATPVAWAVYAGSIWIGE